MKKKRLLTCEPNIYNTTVEYHPARVVRIIRAVFRNAITLRRWLAPFRTAGYPAVINRWRKPSGCCSKCSIPILKGKNYIYFRNQPKRKITHQQQKITFRLSLNNWPILLRLWPSDRYRSRCRWAIWDVSENSENEKNLFSWLVKKEIVSPPTPLDSCKSNRRLPTPTNVVQIRALELSGNDSALSSRSWTLRIQPDSGIDCFLDLKKNIIFSTIFQMNRNGLPCPSNWYFAIATTANFSGSFASNLKKKQSIIFKNKK